MKRFCQDSTNAFDYYIDDCNEHERKIYFALKNLDNGTCYLSEYLFKAMRINYARDIYSSLYEIEETMTSFDTAGMVCHRIYR